MNTECQNGPGREDNPTVREKIADLRNSIDAIEEMVEGICKYVCGDQSNESACTDNVHSLPTLLQAYVNDLNRARAKLYKIICALGIQEASL